MACNGAVVERALSSDSQRSNFQRDHGTFSIDDISSSPLKISQSTRTKSVKRRLKRKHAILICMNSLAA